MGDHDGYLPLPKGFATTAIHAGQDPEQWESLSIVPPITLSTAFKQLGPANPKQFEYSRYGNPSRSVLQQCLAELEGAKYGLCFSSGVSAVAAILGLFKTGDHVVCANDVYIGTYEVLNNVSTSMGIAISFIEATEIDNVEKAIKPTTKLIWIETVTNPTLKVMDVKAISEIAKKHNIIVAVDSTFLTPYFHRPLEFGADLVMHSLTKYINGHSDVVMGAVILNDVKMYEKLNFLQIKGMGNVPSPFDCSLVTRGLKTLAIRMKQHSYNGLIVAQFLEDHPKVVKVNHPGLPSHPQHELFKRQTSGHSGIMSFCIKGDIEQSKKFLNNLKIFAIAHSLGGFESLATLPYLMTHAKMTEEQRKSLNVTENLIRLTIGLEDADDLIKDLRQALNTI